MKIKQEAKRINTLSCIDIYPVDTETNLPLIIFLHGFTSKKEDHILQAAAFAQNGWRVVCMDAHLHGDHALPELEAKAIIAKASRFDEIYMETSKNISKVIDACAGSITGVGLIGVSMGGITILHHLTHNRHELVQAATVCIATPYIENHLRNAPSYLPEFDEYITGDLLTRVRGIEPSRCFEKVNDTPLLFLSSVDDPLAPIDDVRRGVKELREVYDDPGRVKLVEYKGIGHECIPGMFDVAGEWFSRWL
jgi:uncharacterized protein